MGVKISELAALCGAIYQPCDSCFSSFTAKYSPILPPKIDGGFYAKSFIINDISVVIYRGTDAEVSDVASDATLMIGNWQIGNAITYAKAVMDQRSPTTHTIFAGHSLGGALAQAACAVHAKAALSFNGPGLQPGLVAGTLSGWGGVWMRNYHFGFDFANLDKLCRHVCASNDKVSGIGNLRGRYYEVKTGTGVADSHRMRVLYNALLPRTDIADVVIY